MNLKEGLEDMINKVAAIAKGAGRIILQAREQGFSTHTKGDPLDFVTCADLKAEDYILKQLQKAYPDDSILSEERGMIGKSTERLWMVDPLDGTKNFKEGGDSFSVLIGLCDHGAPVLGVVYVPATNTLYYAEKGRGAYMKLNEIACMLSVSSTPGLSTALMVHRHPGEPRKEDELIEYLNVRHFPETSGGIKLCRVASGIADFHINTNPRVKKWDTCAGQAILEEAGGRITDIHGNPLDYLKEGDGWPHSFVASNRLLHPEIIRKIAEYNARQP